MLVGRQCPVKTLRTLGETDYYPNKTMGCTQYEFSTDNRSSRLIDIAYTYVNFYITSVIIIIKVSI